MKTLVLLVALFAFISFNSNAQDGMNRHAYYVISPDGLGKIIIQGDTVTNSKYFKSTDNTEVQNKSVITDRKERKGYEYLICKYIYDKYNSNKDRQPYVLVLKYSNNNDTLRLVGENIPYTNLRSLLSYDPDSKFFFQLIRCS